MEKQTARANSKSKLHVWYLCGLESCLERLVLASPTSGRQTGKGLELHRAADLLGIDRFEWWCITIIVIFLVVITKPMSSCLDQNQSILSCFLMFHSPWKSKDYFLNGFSVKTIVVVGIYNQLKGTILVMVGLTSQIHPSHQVHHAGASAGA